jgi:DNA replication protein DnaC
MLIQPLLDKLIQLRLPAFRDGLQEQLGNPKYAELAFEERLALLVDRECTGRHDRRTQRRIKLANFPQPASIEDLDLSPGRGLDRRLLLELAQCIWIASHLNILVLGPTGGHRPCGGTQQLFCPVFPHFSTALPTGSIPPGRFLSCSACQPG